MGRIKKVAWAMAANRWNPKAKSNGGGPERSPPHPAMSKKGQWRDRS